ncbi:MAG: hypothetical protein EPN39_12040 [Chitinophagaceae bacterium]|nr:MAG: hypothetical protein EPN39_12040 [Chitinophagaceae bacterium]
MKKLFLFMMAFSLVQSTRAQGIFNQDGEMIKKSVWQIVLLTTYGQYVKKGYGIMESRLHTIHEIKNGEFSLHVSYINSLKNVNPKIKGYDEVQAIQTTATALIEGCKRLQTDVGGSDVLNSNEVAYIQNTTAGILKETSEDLNELNLMVSDDKLSMTDEERLKQIDRLYSRVVKSYQNFKSLNSSFYQVTAGRKQALRHDSELKQWYGISGEK